MATPSAGVFASPAGSDSAGDGTIDLPVATIARALEVAATTGQTTIYLSQGTYSEAVRFQSRHAGIFIEGGWVSTGTAWTRDCSADARRKTLIASPDAVGVRVEQLAERSGLRSLSVATKAAGLMTANSAGESCYGVVVTGSNTLFSLEDVAVKAGHGGGGGEATAAVPGSKAACADGVGGCTNGANGGAGPDGGDAVAGSFSTAGYIPGDGQPGTPGGAGKNGTIGTPGQSTSCYLTEGCSCNGGTTNCNATGTRGNKSAGHGTCGCGGDGGNAGGAGRGGGASVGVFASGTGVIVSVTSSAITAGNGGAGSAGGAGLPGATGRAGAKGADATCPVDCVKGGTNCVSGGCRQPSTTLTGGTAGGPGGSGAAGGRGGGGTGGPSYAVVSIGGASVLVSGGPLVPGSAGPGGGSAPAGAAGERYSP